MFVGRGVRMGRGRGSVEGGGHPEAIMRLFVHGGSVGAADRPHGLRTSVRPTLTCGLVRFTAAPASGLPLSLLAFVVFGRFVRL